MQDILSLDFSEIEENLQNQALWGITSSKPEIMSGSSKTPITQSNNSTTSLASTLTTSSASSTTVPKWNIHKSQYDSKGQALDAMSRKYPAPEPESELTMEELLALPPLPRSFRYEMQKNEALRKEDKEERRKEELEAAKTKLRDLAVGIK